MLFFFAFSIPVHLAPSHLVFMSIILWFNTIMWAAFLLWRKKLKLRVRDEVYILISIPYVLLSFLIHEFGHCAAAGFLGFPVIGIFTSYGAFFTAYANRLQDPYALITISAAGPLAQIAAAVPCLLLARRTKDNRTKAVLKAAGFSILTFAFLNLSPISPALDGGQIWTAIKSLK